MAAVRQIVPAVLLGFLVRLWRGFSMLDPFFLIPFACLSAVLAGPIFLDLWKKQQNRTMVGKIAGAVIRSCGSITIILAVPLVILNYPWYETWLLPQWPTAVDAVLLSIASATGAAAATALLVSRLPAEAVKWIFRVLVFAGLVAWRFSPGDWGNTAIVAVMDWGISTTALSIAAAIVAADLGLLYILIRKTQPV